MNGVYCGNNQLTVLPESLSKCIALRKLYCYNNELESLPITIVNCTALVILKSSGNPWDPAWLKAQGAEENPTIESLRELAANQSAGRVKPARV